MSERPEMSMSISAGREPGTISIRMYRLDGSTGRTMEFEDATPDQAERYALLLLTESVRARQLVRTYPARLSED